MGDAGQEVETIYEVLLWDDLVRRDMGRPLFVSAILNAFALLHVAANGTLVRLYRASWKCGSLILYPFVTTLLLSGTVLMLMWLSHSLLSTGLGLPAWATLALGTTAGLAGLYGLGPWLARAFLPQLMSDGIFHWQHANGRRPDYVTRLEAFTDHVHARIRGIEADEIMLVGHSTGALVAAELAARLLLRDDVLGCAGPALSLLTLGSSMPMVAMQPGACSTRAAIEGLVASQRLVWVDFQAPQDWMSFPGFDPSRNLRLRVPAAKIANPIIRSARFRNIMAPGTYRKVDRRPFRTHFQFLMANDFAGVYDIFALTLGSKCLRDRVINEDACPLGNAPIQHGRIDEFRHDYVRGWAFDPSFPDKPVEVEIFINQLHVKRLRADLWRHDLRAKDIGCALHGFIWDIDPPLIRTEDQILVIRRRSDNFEIGRAMLRADS
ncbi:alpha/beta hydrolase [Bradyrhizobium sp. P5_C11_2]